MKPLSPAEEVELPIDQIAVKDRARPLDKDKLNDLKYSIEREGLVQSIAVAEYEGLTVLLAGGHRLEACKQLGWTTIPTRRFTGVTDPGQLRRIELAENLFRNELSVLERALHLKEYLERDPELADRTAEEIAERVGISRRQFFYYKQVASLPPEQVQRILNLPQELRNNRTQLLDFYQLEEESLRDELLATLEGNPETTYSVAKGAVTKNLVERGSLDRPFTITQVMRARMRELKYTLHSHYRFDGRSMTDLVDHCLGLGLAELHKRDYRGELPAVDLRRKPNVPEDAPDDIG